MDILMFSNSPFQHSGYATVAENILKRVNQKSDHVMDVLCCSGIENSQVIQTDDDYAVIGKSAQGGDMGFNDIEPTFDRFKYDILFTVMDWWVFQDKGSQLNIPKVHYCPIDHKELSPMWKNSLQGAMKVVPYTYFGQKVLEDGGVDNIAQPIPHGIDTDVFDKKDAGPEYLGFDEDDFVFGMFKANQGTRLHLVEMLDAFKRFKEENEADDAKLYLHTMLKGANGHDMNYWLDKFDLNDCTRFVNQTNYRMGSITPEALSKAYSSCDVLLNAVKGEGWGLPITEAGACGIPSIATDFSSMPELIGEDEERGWLVPVDRYEPTVGKHAYRSYPEVDAIKDKIAEAYHNPDMVEEKGEKIYEWVQQLDWDTIVDDFWIPLFDAIEEQEEESKGAGPISTIKRERNIDQNEFPVITKHLNDAPGKKVLELGCGSGILAKHLQERGYQVTGVDISEYAIDRAQQRGIEKVYQMDINEDLSKFFTEGQFDAVVSQHVLEHVDDVKVLKDALKLVKGGGIITNIVPTTNHLMVREELDPEHLRYYNMDDVTRLRKELDDAVVTSHPGGQLDMHIGLMKRPDKDE